MNKLLLWMNYILVALMSFVVITFSLLNQKVNTEQRSMMEKQKEKYGVERLTQEHYDEEWKALDKEQEPLMNKIQTKSKWIMILIWFELIALFLYFFTNLRKTDMKVFVRITLIVIITLLVAVFDNTLAAIVLMLVALLLKKKIKPSIHLAIFSCGLFLPYIGIYLTSI